jgi:hypothetical protein
MMKVSYKDNIYEVGSGVFQAIVYKTDDNWFLGSFLNLDTNQETFDNVEYQNEAKALWSARNLFCPIWD